MTYANGGMLAEYGYDAFGNLLPMGGTGGGSGPTWQRLFYTGAYYNPDLGMYQLGPRLYDPTIGRFTTADSWPGTLQWPPSQDGYVYVENDPLDMVDPTGHFENSEHDLQMIETGITWGESQRAKHPGNAQIQSELALLYGAEAITKLHLAAQTVGHVAAAVRDVAGSGAVAAEGSAAVLGRKVGAPARSTLMVIGAGAAVVSVGAGIVNGIATPFEGTGAHPSDIVNDALSVVGWGSGKLLEVATEGLEPLVMAHLVNAAHGALMNISGWLLGKEGP